VHGSAAASAVVPMFRISTGGLLQPEVPQAPAEPNNTTASNRCLAPRPSRERRASTRSWRSITGVAAPRRRERYSPEHLTLAPTAYMQVSLVVVPFRRRRGKRPRLGATGPQARVNRSQGLTFGKPTDPGSLHQLLGYRVLRNQPSSDKLAERERGGVEAVVALTHLGRSYFV